MASSMTRMLGAQHVYSVSPTSLPPQEPPASSSDQNSDQKLLAETIAVETPVSVIDTPAAPIQQNEDTPKKKAPSKKKKKEEIVQETASTNVEPTPVLEAPVEPVSSKKKEKREKKQ